MSAKSRRSSIGEGAAERQTLSFESRARFEAWLAAAHGSSPGIWLRFYKKGSGVAALSYPEALSVALAWGWIDGPLRPNDERSWLRKFSPRGARGNWSKINREHALELISAGQMHPSGLAEVERARRDGRWLAAYDSPKNAQVPADLAAALDDSARASAFFETLDARNRYAILYRVQSPKKAETRARKIQEFVAMLERGEKLHS